MKVGEKMTFLMLHLGGMDEISEFVQINDGDTKPQCRLLSFFFFHTKKNTYLSSCD